MLEHECLLCCDPLVLGLRAPVFNSLSLAGAGEVGGPGVVIAGLKVAASVTPCVNIVAHAGLAELTGPLVHELSLGEPCPQFFLFLSLSLLNCLLSLDEISIIRALGPHSVREHDVNLHFRCLGLLLWRSCFLHKLLLPLSGGTVARLSTRSVIPLIEYF